jgi:hypothetical protein
VAGDITGDDTMTQSGWRLLGITGGAALLVLVLELSATYAYAEPVVATVCVQASNGRLRMSTDGDLCRGPEQRVDWTVGGEITRIEAGDGIAVDPIEGGVGISLAPEAVQAPIDEACGDGSDGSAIAAVNPDGSVLCTAPHGLVGALDAGDLAAAGSLSLSACDQPDFSGQVPTRAFNEVGPITLPPGVYLPVVGYSNEVLGRPLEWRINKTAGRGNPYIFYKGSVRALIRSQQAIGDRRTVSAFRRFFHSDGGGYIDVANQELNVTNQDFGLIISEFTADYYLYVEATASACAWAQIGGQVAFLRIQ